MVRRCRGEPRSQVAGACRPALSDVAARRQRAESEEKEQDRAEGEAEGYERERHEPASLLAIINLVERPEERLRAFVRAPEQHGEADVGRERQGASPCIRALKGG